MSTFGFNTTLDVPTMYTPMLLREARIRQLVQLPSRVQPRMPSQSVAEWAIDGETVTAVTLAQRRLDQGLAPAGSMACFVLLVNEPWSPATHIFFPDAQREFAVSLLMIGYKLLQSFYGEEQSMIDCWRTEVMPHAIGLHP